MSSGPHLVSPERIPWVRASWKARRWWRLAAAPGLVVVCTGFAFVLGMQVGFRVAPVRVVLEAEAGGDLRGEPGTAAEAMQGPEVVMAAAAPAAEPGDGGIPTQGMACHAAEEGDRPTPTGLAVPGASRLVDINTASAQELDSLPGIGPSLAARIVEFRERHGAFAGVDDLLEVRGIGPKVLQRLRPLVTATPR